MCGWVGGVLKLEEQSKKKEWTTQRPRGSKQFDGFEKLKKNKIK